MSQQDVELGLRFSTDTQQSIEATKQRLERLDKAIISIQNNLAKTELDISQTFNPNLKLKNQSSGYISAIAQYEAEQKELQKLLRQSQNERKAAERLLSNEAKTLLKDKPNNPEHAKKVQSFIKSTFQQLTDSTIDVVKAQLDAVKQFQKQITKEMERARKLKVESNQNLSVQGLLRGNPISQLSDGELRALKRRANSLSRDTSDAGNYRSSTDYLAVVDALSSEIKNRQRPELRTRNQLVSNLANSRELAYDFSSYAKPSELKQAISDSKRRSKEYAAKLDTENAEKMARLANHLNTALKELDPKVSRLYETARTLKADPASMRRLQKKSIDELLELQSSMMSQAKKDFKNGNGTTGQLLANASNELREYINDRKSPHVQERQRLLKDLAIGGGDNLSSFNRAGLESLKRDALKTSRDLSAVNPNDKLAEAMRKLADKIQKQIDKDKPVAEEKSKTAKSRVNEYKDIQIQEFARKRFNDSLFSTGAYSNLANQSLSAQKSALEMTKKLKAAQELRHANAELNKLDKKEIDNEKRLLDIANKRLETVKRIVATTEKAANKQNPNIKDVQQSVNNNLLASRLRRETDNGAEMFRNQGLLLRNYAVMGAGVGSAYAIGQFTVDLDRSLKQLQSILALTNNEMVALEDNLIRVSEKTKFTAVEVTEAGIILGQAGLSKDQIVETIEGITLFATAVGTDLKSSVDLATSTLGVYRMEASRMPEVVDKLTTAVNNSKLNLEKISLGIQYAGNIAAQSNVSFEETISTLAAMANSGIRSGSTLGTGLRQILITLQNPTEKFRKKVNELGIDMADLDIRTHGLVNVMSTLANSGFTVTDAMQTMEVRAAAAFGAFANNLDVAEKIAGDMERGGAASKANAVQMESLSHQWARFGSIAKSIFYDALKPHLGVITEILKSTGDWLSELKQLGTVLQFILGTATAIGAIKVSASLVKLVHSLAKSPISKLLATGAGSGVATRAGIGIGARALSLAGGPVGLALGLGVTGLAYGAQAYNDDRKYNDPLDRATASVNENEGDLDRYNSWLKTLASSMDDLYLKQAQFQKGDGGTEALTKFINRLNNELKDMGFYLDSNASSFEDVSSKLQEFRTKVADLKTIGLNQNGELVTSQLRAQIDALQPFVESEKDLARGVGVRNKQSLERSDKEFFDSYNYGSRWTALFTAEKAFPQLDNQGASKAILDLANLDVESGVGPASLESYQRLVKYRNELTGIGNLPESQLRDILQDPKSGYRVTDIDRALENFQGHITQRLSTIQTLLNKASEIVEASEKFEKINANEPQVINELVSELQNEFQPQVRNLQVQFSNNKQRINKEFKGDPLGKFKASKKSEEDYREAIKLLQDEITQKAKESLIASFGDASKLNRVLNKSSVLASSQGVISEALAFTELNRKPAQRAYLNQSEAELGILQQDKTYAYTRLQNATSVAKVQEIESTIIAIEDKIANIQKERRRFEIDPKNQVALEELDFKAQTEKASRDRVIAEKADQREVRIETRNQLKAMREYRDALRDLRILKGFDKDQARAFRDFYKALLKEFSVEMEKVKTQAQVVETKADIVREQADKAKLFAGDTQVSETQRINQNIRAGRLYQNASDLDTRALGIVSSGLRNENGELSRTIETFEALLASDQLGFELRKTITALLADFKKELEGNNRSLAGLTDKQVENNKRLNEQKDALNRNTSELSKSGYRYYSSDRLRRKAELNGESFVSDSGQVEDFSRGFSGSTSEQFFKTLLTESNKAYEGMDALTEASFGLIDTMKSMGDVGASAFKSWATGSKSASGAFKDFTMSVLDSLSDLATKIAMNALMEQLIGIGLSMYGGTTSSAGSFSTTGTTMSAWNGGLVMGGRYASGGLITTGIESRDSTLIKAAKGEFVLRRAAVEALGVDRVRALNNLDKNSMESMEKNSISQPLDLSKDDSPKASGDINVWVVTPEEQQQLGPNDVLVTVQDDILRNGKTKQLIKSISRGDI